MNKVVNLKDLHKIYLGKVIKDLKEKHIIKKVKGVFKNENKPK